MAVLTLEDCSAYRAPGRQLRRIDKLMTALIEARFATRDMTFMQWVALKVVRDGDAGNAGELARELSITTGATTRMIDVLERRGLIARDRGASDRRVVRLAITEPGLAAVAALQDDVVAAWNEVLADFDQDEVDHMVADLIRLRAAAERVAAASVLAEAVE